MTSVIILIGVFLIQLQQVEFVDLKRTVIGGIIILHDLLPKGLGLIGLILVIIVMIASSLVSND